MTSTVRLGDIVKILGGGTPDRTNPDFWDGDIPWVTVKDVQGNRITRSQETITKLGLDKSASNLIPSGSIVVPTRMALGRVAINDVPIAINQDLKALIVDPAAIDRDFLQHFLVSKAKYFESRGKGATVKGITLDVLTDLNVPKFPLDRQRHLAAILNKAEDICRKRGESIKLIDQFLRSVFLDMFGDPIRNEKGWTQSTVGEIASGRGEIVDGPFGSSLKPDQYVDEGIRVIRNFNVRPGYFDQSAYKYVTSEKFAEIRRSEVCEGDLLLSTKGTVGNVCLMPRLEGASVLSATGTVRIRISSPNVEPVFLMRQMLTSQYQRYIEENQSGAVQQYLNLSGIRDLAIILPPRELQFKFSEIAKRVNMLAKKAQNARCEADKLYASLAHRSFSGQQ